MKKILTLIACLAGAVLIVLLPEYFSDKTGFEIDETVINEEGMFAQKIESVTAEPHSIHKIYYKGQLIGILEDYTELDAFLAQIYQEEYKEEFPGSDVSLGKDVYVAAEQSWFRYTDASDQIFQYLKDNELFSLKTTAVTFSELGEDEAYHVYAEIYIKDEAMYEEAMNTYLSFFVNDGTLNTLTQGDKTPALTTYGTRDVEIRVSENMVISESYAPASAIKKTKEEILDYLEYGENTEKEYYTVEEYDTVAGVGAKNHGLSATQIMNINRDKILSVDQALKKGDQLCVTYFNSPITVVVTKEAMRKEEIYPETVYIEDPEIEIDTRYTEVAGSNGTRNALYTEKWVNGVLVRGELVSSVDIVQPVNTIVHVGTMPKPGIGTGIWRWPVDNHYISCYWGCYYGHRAIDIVNLYDPYGFIYAADSGVIIENSYNSVNGYYVIIDHNNGYISYYGHMSYHSPLDVGTVVTKGDVIGNIGMTGYATGPHTHFFIGNDYDNRYNPCNGFLDCSS